MIRIGNWPLKDMNEIMLRTRNSGGSARWLKTISKTLAHYRRKWADRRRKVIVPCLRGKRTTN